MTVAAKLELANLLVKMGVLDTNDYIKFLNLPSEKFLKELELLEQVRNTKLYKAMKDE